MQVLPILGTTLLVMIAGYLTAATQTVRLQDWPLVTETPEQPSSAGQDRQVDLVPAPRAVSSFVTITQRPLFVASRRPIVPTPVNTTIRPKKQQFTLPIDQPARAPQLRLLGVMTDGARNAALVSENGARPQWHRIGADIQGWTLSKVAPDHIILEQDSATHRVELYQR